MEKKRNIFIGLAWPYANGSLHLGHASAFLGADIIARYHRLKGDSVLLVSGSDCYGTPIALEATERGVEPASIAEFYHEEFTRTLIDGLGISYDLYTKTMTDQHATVVQELFLNLLTKDLLYKKTKEALYSPLLERFLPDRFVEGTCPHCGTKGARGDQCDHCGNLLDPLELIGPKINPKILGRSANVDPEKLNLTRRESEHFYLKLSALESKLEKWVKAESGAWRVNASSFATGFLKQGLKDRAITRDTDWGVPVPLPGYEEKRIYVWFEAVIGYLSASKKWAEGEGDPDAWKEFWENDDAWHYYVHGKDNIPFHTIIWPAILLGAKNLHLPDQIISSEYLTLEGRQFSKSRGWAVWLPDFLGAFDAETLRFFLTLYGPETGDSDFSWKDFGEKVNGELIATYGNLINRTLTLVEKHFPEGVAFTTSLDNESTALLTRAQSAFESVGSNIEAGHFRAALREVFDIAQLGNKYMHEKEPWIKIKDEQNRSEVEQTLAVAVKLITILATLAYPFLPRSSERIGAYTGQNIAERWGSVDGNQQFFIKGVKSLYRKITDDEVAIQEAKLGTKP